MIVTHYGTQLQALRRNCGLSRDEVSVRSGISRSTIAKIEAGISIPSIEMMIRLANSLRLRLPTLLLKVGVIEKQDTVRALTEIKNGNGNRLLKRKG
jgi:transcriptional regulator with XRE-family HTH domain